MTRPLFRHRVRAWPRASPAGDFREASSVAASRNSSADDARTRNERPREPRRRSRRERANDVAGLIAQVRSPARFGAFTPGVDTAHGRLLRAGCLAKPVRSQCAGRNKIRQRWLFRFKRRRFFRTPALHDTRVPFISTGLCLIAHSQMYNAAGLEHSTLPHA